MSLDLPSSARVRRQSFCTTRGVAALLDLVRCESDVGAAIDACSRGGAAVRAIAEEPASSGPSKQSAVIEDIVALYQY